MFYSPARPDAKRGPKCTKAGGRLSTVRALADPLIDVLGRVRHIAHLRFAVPSPGELYNPPIYERGGPDFKLVARFIRQDAPPRDFSRRDASFDESLSALGDPSRR